MAGKNDQNDVGFAQELKVADLQLRWILTLRGRLALANFSNHESLRSRGGGLQTIRAGAVNSRD